MTELSRYGDVQVWVGKASLQLRPLVRCWKLGAGKCFLESKRTEEQEQVVPPTSTTASVLVSLA